MKEVIEKEIPHLPVDGRVYFFTDGTWSLFELIDYILDHIPPSHVTLSSFSMSEDSIRHLLYLKESGRILSLQGLFDPSARKTKTPLLYFAKEVFDSIGLLQNHAKIILFENGKRNLCVLGSANLGRNRRLEAGVIEADPKVFTFFLDHLKQAIVNGQKI